MQKFLPVIALLLMISFGCEKSADKRSGILTFSSDTVHFDTVFTTIGTATMELRVKNSSRRPVTIESITLTGGSGSSFRLNIDGKPSISEQNIDIAGRDSIFIFVDAVVDPTNSNSPVSIRDSILFRLHDESLYVQLQAWGQDIYLHNNEVLQTQVWDNKKPHLIYGSVIVDTANTLLIDAGTKVYFHNKSSLKVAGTIDAAGTVGSPILFATDRLEEMYTDIPGQWTGIYLLNTSTGNRFSNSVIRNSVNGIMLGEAVQYQFTPPTLKLFNSIISHSTITGLAVINGEVKAVNTIINHCGKYCLYLRAGGDYSFTHCTFFNQWDYGFRLAPVLYVSENPAIAGGPSSQVYFTANNTVFYGDLPSEIEIKKSSKGFSGSYFFDHCLIKLDTTSVWFWQPDKFSSPVVNRNPLFIDVPGYDLRPDTLSPLMNTGNQLYINEFPLDIRGASRETDGKPDIGAYERIPGEKKKIKQ